MGITTDERERRLWARLERRESGCLIWTGALFENGYGLVSWAGRKRKVHQIVWELTRGPRPAGLEPDHLCRVRSCAEPDHLEWVTHAENMRRAHCATGQANYNGAKTHCAHGHEFTPENTRLDRLNRRCCRACHRRDSARRRKAKLSSP